MAKNKIQFQKSLCIHAFIQRQGDDPLCQQRLFQMRWPDGYCCPNCGHTHCCQLKSRAIYQCHHQASVTAGTLFAYSKLPLRGFIQLDDAYWGGVRASKPGRGAASKRPFVAAVALNQTWHPLRMRFSVEELTEWAKAHLKPESQVVSDGLACFRGITAAEVEHQPIVTGGGPKSVKLPYFKWANTMISNVKNAMHGTYHAISLKHLPRYLSEFCFKFNHRF